jgi:hypothetical protein
MCVATAIWNTAANNLLLINIPLASELNVPSQLQNEAASSCQGNRQHHDCKRSRTNVLLQTALDGAGQARRSAVFDNGVELGNIDEAQPRNGGCNSLEFIPIGSSSSIVIIRKQGRINKKSFIL